VEWDGELILSLFIRVTKPGRDLFVEANYLLLTPVRDSLRRLDSISARRAWKHAIEIALTSIPWVLAWPLMAFKWMEGIEKWRHRREIRKRIRDDATFDRGALSSIREEYSSAKYHRYFQKLDKEMYHKVLEKHILDTIVDFLEIHNVDTSDLKQRQQFILNSGVIVGGGGSVYNMGAMSVGAQSQAAAAGGKK
jgi:hypothetical protein